MSVPTAAAIITPIGGPNGARHQVVKVPAASAFTPAHFNPVPAAADLQGGTVGVVYAELVTVQGGTPAYSFAVSAGSLPPGLMLGSSTGQIAGTPSLAAVYSFTVTVTDANGFQGSQSFTIAIVSPSVGGNYGFVA